MSIFLWKEVLTGISPTWSKIPNQKGNVLIWRGMLGYTVSLWAVLSSQGWGKSLIVTCASLNNVFYFWRKWWSQRWCPFPCSDCACSSQVFLLILEVRCYVSRAALSLYGNTCLNLPVFIMHIPWEPSAVNSWAMNSLFCFIHSLKHTTCTL